MSWEVSISELKTEKGTRWKVTRRLPGLLVAETKIFSSKEEAQRQYEGWLQ
ncbi:hypothetical protein HY493_04755 [Candidatus Woesearchaeota archaeon]|nr:hypothetical protein [Candidatus Woesearchaeota archaeon]